MNYEDDNSERKNNRGRSEGSRRHRFSKHNQPRRRRQRVRRVSTKEGLLENLQRPVTVTIEGKQKKMSVYQVLLQTVSQEALKASLPDKLRFLEKLDKLGISAVQASQERLDEERQEFEHERRQFEELQRVREILLRGAQQDAAEAKAQWYAAAHVLRQLEATCTCGACNTFEQSDIGWLLKELEDDEEADRLHEELLGQLREYRASQSQDEGDGDWDGESAEHFCTEDDEDSVGWIDDREDDGPINRRSDRGVSDLDDDSEEER